MRRIAFILVAALGLAAHAQEFPSRQPVKLIVTFAPGGGSDTIARTLNAKMGEALGQVVIVENKAGAGGAIATDFVAKSAPDGYNVLFTVSSHSINQALVPGLPFDTERDLRGVTLIGALPQVLAVHPSVAANNLQEWIALRKKDRATLAALKDPAVSARMESQAGIIIGGAPAELDALVASEIQQFTRVVREQGLKPE